MSTFRTKSNKIRVSHEDRAFDIILLLLTILVLIVTLYPLYFVLCASFSSPNIVNTGEILLYPKEFTTKGYEMLLKDERIWIGYKNTLIYVVFGTILAVFVTTMAGYSLSRKDLPGRNIIMGLFVFTMYFKGGLIPTYLIVKKLGLVNKPIVIIILGAVSVYNIIIIRSYFINTIPLELQEAAFIDGCTNQYFFFKIVLPLSKPIITVIALYSATGHWNGFFNALIYLNKRDYYPLQIFIRDIMLIANAFNESSLSADQSGIATTQQILEILKYSLIIISTVPMLIVYPFMQKYFVKGVMIGAIKG